MPLSRPTHMDLATTTSPLDYSSPLRTWRVTLDTGELGALMVMNNESTHDAWPSWTPCTKVPF